MDKLYGRISGIYLNSCVCLIRFLLALNFVFSKTKMFKLLFILFVIKQLLGTGQHRVSIFIQPKKVLSNEGKLSGVNSDRNIAHLKRTNFSHIYF